MTGDRIRLGMLGALLLATAWQAQTHAAVPRAAAGVRLQDAGADIPLSGGTLSLRLISGNVLHVHFIPATGATPPTVVMAPHADAATTSVVASRQGSDLQLCGGRFRIALDET
jgi:hypothetical protein